MCVKNRRIVLISLALCIGLGVGLWVASRLNLFISPLENDSDFVEANEHLSQSKGETRGSKLSDDRENSGPDSLSTKASPSRTPRLPIPSQEVLDDSLKKLGITQVGLKKIRDELANEGTHHTPQSYLELATQVGERVDQLADPKPLSDCALAPQAQADFYLPLAALCLSFLNEVAVKRSKQGAPGSASAEIELGPTWSLYQQTLQSVNPSVLELSTAALDEN